MRLQLGAEPCMQQCTKQSQIPDTWDSVLPPSLEGLVSLQSRIRITKPADMLPHPLKPLSNEADAVELSPAATFDAHASEGAREQYWLEETGRLPADGLARLASPTRRAQGGG